jgi:hypothetical protein
MTRQVESRYGVSLLPSSWISPWIVRHVSWCLTRFATHGTLKRSSYIVTRGVEYNGIIAELGEYVMIRTKALTNEKMDSRWVTEIFVGKGNLTDEWLVAKPARIEKARTRRRLPLKAALDKDKLLHCRGQPEDPRPKVDPRIPLIPEVDILLPYAIPPSLYARETIDVYSPNNKFDLLQGQSASASSGGPAVDAAIPPSPSRDIPMAGGSSTPLAPMSPGTPLPSPEKRSRAAPADSSK